MSRAVASTLLAGMTGNFLGYARMVLLALPYTVTITVAGLLAMIFFL